MLLGVLMDWGTYEFYQFPTEDEVYAGVRVGMIQQLIYQGFVQVLYISFSPGNQTWHRDIHNW